MKLAARHLPAATYRAINDTAYDAIDAVKDHMKMVFDRPTPFALRFLNVKRATLSNPEAIIHERPDVGPRHFLKVQGAGGVRPNSALEKLLQVKVATASYIAAIAPGGSARLDQYGNWSAGERTQALSAIKAQRDVTRNTTERSKKLARNKGRAAYFVPQDGSKLGSGIYRRNGSRGKPEPVLNFLSARPTYQKRIDYREIVEGTVAAVYEEHFAFRLSLLTG